MIEKPILLKKRNMPNIGMTLLSHYEPKVRKTRYKYDIIELPSIMERKLQIQILKAAALSHE